MPNFGKKLKDLRQSAKMTQQELAKELGISKSAVSGYEQDATPKKIKWYSRIPTLRLLIGKSGI